MQELAELKFFVINRHVDVGTMYDILLQIVRIKSDGRIE